MCFLQDKIEENAKNIYPAKLLFQSAERSFA